MTDKVAHALDRPTDSSLVGAFWANWQRHALFDQNQYNDGHDALERVRTDALYRDEGWKAAGRSDLPSRGELLVQIESLRHDVSELEGRLQFEQQGLAAARKRADILCLAVGESFTKKGESD